MFRQAFSSRLQLFLVASMFPVLAQVSSGAGITIIGGGGGGGGLIGGGVETGEVSGRTSFGEVLVGRAAIGYVNFRNSREHPIEVTSIEAPPGFRAQWKGVIPPNGIRRFRVVFRPVSVHDYSGTLKIHIRDEPTKNIQLSGEGGELPDSLSHFAVGGRTYINLPPAIKNIGVVQGVVGLPPGLLFAPARQVIEGRLARAGNFNYTIQVLRRGDGALVSIPVAAYVDNLPSYAKGRFVALLSPPTDEVGSSARRFDLGGRIGMLITPGGLISGNLRLGNSGFPFRGRLEGIVVNDREPNSPFYADLFIRTGSGTFELYLQLRPEDGSELAGFTGHMFSNTNLLLIESGWKSEWHQVHRPAFDGIARRLHTACSVGSGASPENAEGYSVFLLRPSGIARSYCVFPDGRRGTCAMPVSPDEEIPLCATTPVAGHAMVAIMPTGRTQDERVTILEDGLSDGRWVSRWRSSSSESQSLDREVNFEGAEFRIPEPEDSLFGDGLELAELSLVLTGGEVASTPHFANASDILTDSVILNLEASEDGLMTIHQGDFDGRLRSRLGMRTGKFVGKAMPRAAGPRPLVSLSGLFIPSESDPLLGMVRGHFRHKYAQGGKYQTRIGGLLIFRQP